MLDALAGAVQVWVERGRPGPVGRWVERELDPEGVPKRLPVPDWLEGLRRLAGAVRGRAEGWPERFDARVEGWVRATLRLAHPGGSPAFGAASAPSAAREVLQFWADRLADPGLFTVLDWWFPPARERSGRDARHAPPPLPADARPDRPLASLRAHWLKQGDLLAVDHREPGPTSLVDLGALGRSWLGPDWGYSPATLSARPGRARPTLWVTQSLADVLEWSFPVGKARVVRTAVLLRGRKLALLAEQWDGPGDPGASRWALAPGVQAVPLAETRALALSAGSPRTPVKVYPPLLPRLPYPTEAGAFGCEGRDLVLRSRAPGAGPAPRRSWRPILISWDPRRDRKVTTWRVLTVSEGKRVCSPETAVATRVSWGREDTLVVYRSLARPALRAFLGHPTRARFLIGVFTAEGEVEPLVKVED